MSITTRVSVSGSKSRNGRHLAGSLPSEGLAIFAIEVPAPAQRFSFCVQQNVMHLSHPTIEMIQHKCLASTRPKTKRFHRAIKMLILSNFERQIQALTGLFDFLPHVPVAWFGDDQLPWL